MPPPDLVAQAADFPDRDSYVVFPGLDPLQLPEFCSMALSLWPLLEQTLAELEEVGPALRQHQCACVAIARSSRNLSHVQACAIRLVHNS